MITGLKPETALFEMDGSFHKKGFNQSATCLVMPPKSLAFFQLNCNVTSSIREKPEKPRAGLNSVACIPLDRPCARSSNKKKDIKMTNGNSN